MPTVSICVQTYQHAAFIKQCLDGLLRQEANFQYEILLGEDCSTDGTREICKIYAEKYPGKIRLFLHDRKDNIVINGKPSGRYNFLNNLKNVRGKYFAICEGDDYWCDENKLQKQYDFLERNQDYSICFHEVSILENSQLSHSYLAPEKAGTTSIIDLARKNYIYTCSCFYRNHLPKTFPKSLIHAPFFDYVLHLYISQYGKIKYLPENMAVYRIHDGGLWSSLERSEQLLGLTHVINPLLDYFKNNIDVSRELNKQKLEAYMELADCYQDIGETDKLSECLKIISQQNPAVFIDLFYELHNKLELFDEIRNKNNVLTQKLKRLVNHPVAGNVIRLLAKIKRDSDFGQP